MHLVATRGVRVAEAVERGGARGGGDWRARGFGDEAIAIDARAREVGFEPPPALARGVDRVRQATNLALGSHHSAVPRGGLRGGARVRGGGDVHRRGRTRRRRFGSVGARTRAVERGVQRQTTLVGIRIVAAGPVPPAAVADRVRARRNTRVFEIARGVAEDASALATNRRHLVRDAKMAIGAGAALEIAAAAAARAARLREKRFDLGAV